MATKATKKPSTAKKPATTKNLSPITRPRFSWLFDNGHGINTPEKRSPDWEQGVLMEGVKNREIVKAAIKRLRELCVICYELTPETEDIGLMERVRRANRHNNAIFVSIHCDAWGDPDANGWSVWTTRGYTKADPVSNVFFNSAKSKLKGMKTREDRGDIGRDPDFEANFTVLKGTKCPAVLIENGFMTNPSDYKYLMSKKGVANLVEVIVDAVLNIERNGIKLLG